jgi:hypothetical protein
MGPIYGTWGYWFLQARSEGFQGARTRVSRYPNSWDCHPWRMSGILMPEEVLSHEPEFRSWRPFHGDLLADFGLMFGFED